ncbi:MAG: serine proteinase [Eubacteriales bacterium]
MSKFDFDQFKEKTGDVAKKTVEVSQQLAEMAKLQLDNHSQEEVVKRAYIEIGKAYFEQSGKQPDPLFEKACARVTMAKEVIEENNVRIYNLRNGNPAPDEEDDFVTETQFEVVPPEEETENTETTEQ